MNATAPKPFIAVACGGTGGHLFPGIAVAEALQARNADILLIISPKAIDQQAVKSARGMEVFALPASGLSRGQVFKSLAGLFKSFSAVRKVFSSRAPEAVLSMGSFTSVAPVLAGKMRGAATFLHESNTIPGKANRWLSHFVEQAFVAFPSAANRLSARNVATTGTPVRPQFEPGDAASARMAMGFAPDKPVLLIMGGSQGASGINELIINALPHLVAAFPDLQFLHLAGEKEFERVRSAYAAQKCRSVIRPFLTEMELAMAAGTLAISRAGGSTLAELAATRLPPILIPFPAATNNHQFYNARALADVGAAWIMEQRETSSEKLAEVVIKLLRDPVILGRMKEELVRWHSPNAADQIADKIFTRIDPLGRWLSEKNGATLRKTSSVLA
jgi:UDP-N-acetylglucosamine--N-acetylmuramyl-(pentapeptide) pyrophosphoryl-undecaprenol N-acetylglucosamine transferase